jgi:hypothetical protein
MFVLLLLRTKYGPQIILLVGVAFLAVGVGGTHRVVTGLGAALITIGAGAAAMRKAKGDPNRGRDDDLGAIGRSTHSSTDGPSGEGGW